MQADLLESTFYCLGYGQGGGRGLVRSELAGATERPGILLKAEAFLGEVLIGVGAGQNPVEQYDEGRHCEC
jgi:hypothetical protein